MARPKIGDVVRVAKHLIDSTLGPVIERQNDPWMITSTFPGANFSTWYVLVPVSEPPSIWFAGEDWFTIDPFLTAVHRRKKHERV